MPSRLPTNSPVRETGASSAGETAGGGHKTRPFLHRLAWFIAIWAASVAFLTLVAALIRLAL
jgi:uncharacterized protein DUF2474